MKKYSLILVVLMLMLAMVGCNKKAPTQEVTPATSANATPTATSITGIRVVTLIDNSGSATKLMGPVYRPALARLAKGLERKNSVWNMFTFVGEAKPLDQELHLTQMAQLYPIFNDFLKKGVGDPQRGTMFQVALQQILDEAKQHPNIYVCGAICTDGGFDDPNPSTMIPLAEELAVQPNLLQIVILRFQDPNKRRLIQDKYLKPLTVSNKLLTTNEFDEPQNFEAFIKTCQDHGTE